MDESEFVAANRPFLSGEVAAHIRQLIVSSRGFAPDEFIRVVPLAAKLGVSPTPVREALMALWQQGFLEQIPRRGFRVIRLTRDDILDLFLMLGFTGGELAARATSRITDDQLRQLQAMQAHITALQDAGAADEIDALDHEFHWLIYEAAASPKFLWVQGLAYNYIPHGQFASIDYRAISNAGHKRLMDALIRRDAEAAREATVDHLKQAGRKMAEGLPDLG
jgi:DNA-binding GntR family transcriptional regulator